LAAALAGQAGASAPPAAAGEGKTDQWLAAVVKDLTAHRGRCLVLVGPGQPASVHALVHAINDSLGNVGQTLNYIEPVEARPENQLASLRQLTDDMRAGQVGTLIMIAGNPVYSAPAELDFAGQLQKVTLRVHLSPFADETSFLCDWHIPQAHELESWGDARAFDGTATIQQPLIAPLYGGRTPYELLAVLMDQAGQTPYDLVQKHWQGQLSRDDFGRDWRRAVHAGVVPDTASATADVQLQTPLADLAAQPASSLPAGTLQVEFRPDPTIWDGQFANNGWLQELPKPLTKITWDNVAMVSPATARELGLATEQLVTITIDGRTIEAPVWVMPGQSDHCVSLTFGYGRTRCGRVGVGIGYNAYSVRPAQPAWFAAGELRPTTGRYRLATTQNHHTMEGRDIVRVTTLDRQSAGAHEGARHLGEYLPTLFEPYPSSGNAWGMVIDQTACIGCNACMVACQSENNVPIVGKEQVQVGREMHWLRIDRYYHGELESPETYFQPMLCQHCEAAPCEVVCPVAATVHDSEGTNNMVYNRCVGTRYCSNNCPYKVRRFNYLQFSDETTPSLKLLRNPDVTVRSRGVMEKCTYCIQRISHARIEAKKEDRPIRDGEVLTACQQACPTRAIVFGNLNDPSAAVTKQKQLPLNYGVLAELGTLPRTTYLSRVMNPHPDLPGPAAANRRAPDTGGAAHQSEAHS
jgi:molybdopterin-containing oxidoreductase family iron-sulfur binding subunit